MSTTVIRTTTEKLEAVIAEQESEDRTLLSSQFVGGRDWVLFFTQMITLESTAVRAGAVIAASEIRVGDLTETAVGTWERVNFIIDTYRVGQSLNNTVLDWPILHLNLDSRGIVRFPHELVRVIRNEDGDTA